MFADLRTAGLIQGSSLQLSFAKRTGIDRDKNDQISFNCRVNSQPPLPARKLVTTFPVKANIWSSFYNIDPQTNIFNAHQDQIPTFNWSGCILTIKELSKIGCFSFEDFDCYGNHSLIVSYTNVSPDQFNEYLSSLLTVDTRPSIETESRQHIRPVDSPTLPNSKPDPVFKAEGGSDDVETPASVDFSVIHLDQIEISEAPNLPESFYNLTASEMKHFYSAYQKTASDLLNRPLVSAKYLAQQKRLNQSKSIPIKFILTEKVQVITSVSFDSPCKALYAFVADRIIYNAKESITLCLGHPPIKIMDDDSTLEQIGITSATRVLIKCGDPFSYRPALNLTH